MSFQVSNKSKIIFNMQFYFKCVKANSLHGSCTENGNGYGAHSEPTQVLFCFV